MKIHITRTLTNNSYTMGRLEIEGQHRVLYTQELAIPKNRTSYVAHCLPCGEYPVVIRATPFTIKGTDVRLPCFELKRVPWFPKADFVLQWEGIYLKPGHIRLGWQQIDEFNVEQKEDVLRYVARLCNRFYDKENDCETEEITLCISESADIVRTDDDVLVALREEAARKELEAKKAVEEEFLYYDDEDEWAD